MRILFAIAHFHRPDPDGFYGSRASSAANRAHALRQALANLHITFGQRQAILLVRETRAIQANAGGRHDIEIAICTDGRNHLLDQVPPHLFRHHVVDGDPRYLGYGCHEILAAGIDKFDYFCFLEDDIVVTDGEFFDKLAWFADLAGEDCLLQPNRFEFDVRTRVQKLYVDGDLYDPSVSRRFQDIDEDRELAGRHLGRDIRFKRYNNAHAGCFFLSRAQLHRWMDQSYFLDRGADYYGPLESAATLGLMKTFKVYKPALANANFLEVRHGDPRYLAQILRFDDAWNYRRVTRED